MSIIKEMKAENLKVKIYDTRQSMGKAASREVAVRIKYLLGIKNEINMVFAAAPSQNEFLTALIKYKGIDWTRVNAFHMDEYIGLDSSASQGFGTFLKKMIFERVPFKSVNYLDGNASDSESECLRYSLLLKESHIDIVCMGIGENGHIAFNDPHIASFDDSKLVKVVELDQKCRQQQVNDGCFNIIDEVPTHALALTIPVLMSSANVFCMVPSKTKAEAVYNTIKGKISENCPASILKKHRNAILYVDVDSAIYILE